MNTTVRGWHWWWIQQARWQDLPRLPQLYRIGVALLGSALLLGAASAPSALVVATFLTGAGACGLALSLEVYSWVAPHTEKQGLKAMLAVLGVMAGAIATGAAATYVAVATGQEPAAFKTTTVFLAPFAFLPVLALLLGLAAMFCFPFVLLLSIGREPTGRGKQKNEALWLMGRLVGLVTLVAVLFSIPSTPSGVDAKLKELAAYSAYFLDMQPHASCGLAEGDRIVRINDRLVVIGRPTDDGVAFARQECLVVSASTVALPPARSVKPH